MANMTRAHLVQLQERGGPALRLYEKLMASNDWPKIQEFQHRYATDSAAVEAAAAAEEVAASGGKQP